MPQNKARSRRKRTVRAANRAQDLAASVYLPLFTDRKEIRLLSLSPGQFQDKIHCSLSKYSLNECPPYEALSYVWGAGLRRQIFVNGVRKLVTLNLEIALRHLRHASQIRVLWVDAICINQRDIPERNTQVIHMGNVYRTAFRVIAWLGEEGEDSNLAYDAFEALPMDEQVHWDISKIPAVEKIFLEPKYTTAIAALFRRAWWQRIWIVQESILGVTLHFICGNREIAADKLFALSKGYEKHSRSCCRQFVWEHIESNFEDFIIYLNRLRKIRTTKNCYGLLKLLGLFRSRLCTDPRDKVYGILGLCSGEESKEILPDYSTPVSLVYEQVALSIINKTESLDVFSQVCPGLSDGGKLANVTLPSWVPDWTLEISERDLGSLYLRQERNDEYMASSGVFASVGYVKQGKIALKGILLGVVAILGTPNTSGVINKSIGDNWRNMARVEALPNRLYNEASIPYYDAFWQTLCCSIIVPRTSSLDGTQIIRTRNNVSYRSWYNSWWTWVSEFDADNDKIDLVSSEYTGSEIFVFGALVEVSTYMRRLFISRDEEWLGLAPANAIAGDVIALLAGGSVPYILRPRSEAQDGDYELIGDAYVHGAMDGERWNPDLVQDIFLV